MARAARSGGGMSAPPLPPPSSLSTSWPPCPFLRAVASQQQRPLCSCSGCSHCTAFYSCSLCDGDRKSRKRERNCKSRTENFSRNDKNEKKKKKKNSKSFGPDTTFPLRESVNKEKDYLFELVRRFSLAETPARGYARKNEIIRIVSHEQVFEEARPGQQARRGERRWESIGIENDDVAAFSRDLLRPDLDLFWPGPPRPGRAPPLPLFGRPPHHLPRRCRPGPPRRSRKRRRWSRSRSEGKHARGGAPGRRVDGLALRLRVLRAVADAPGARRRCLLVGG